MGSSVFKYTNFVNLSYFKGQYQYVKGNELVRRSSESLNNVTTQNLAGYPQVSEKVGTNQVNFDYYSNRNAQTSNNTSGIIGIGSGQQEQDAYAQWWAQYYAENPELYNRQDGFFTGSDQTTKEKIQDIRQQGSTAIKNFDRVTKQMFSHFVDNYTPVSTTYFSKHCVKV